MSEFAYFSIFITLAAFSVGLRCQKRWKSPLLNPILIAAALVMIVLSAAGIPNAVYQEGCKPLQYLLTPATICLSISFYEQLEALKKKLPAIAAGVALGSLSGMGSILLLCKMFHLSSALTASLLPKSVTTAIGVVLAEEGGGISAVATGAIIITGIMGNVFGPVLCKIFHFRDPIAQGVALGTASHVIGTARANELGQITGAVSSVSLTLAGLLTAVFYSFILNLI